MIGILKVNVYIKSFNRPFYLDRCIRSIKFNVVGYSKIIVLDDGTLSKYIKRLSDLHPEVEFRSSGADDRKYELLRAECFSQIESDYPVASDFWLAELSKEPSSYFFLLEDDAWVCRRIDLTRIVQSLELNNAVMCKFWWPDEVEELHRVTHSLRAHDGQGIDYYDFSATKIVDLYVAWVVAFAVFRTDYWLNNFSGIKRMADEQTQLCNVQAFISAHPQSRFAKSPRRIVYQGWAVPGRSTPEYYDKGLRQHLYMDALNEAWFDEDFDVDQGYPFDYSDEYIQTKLRLRLPRNAVDVWKEWKVRDIRYAY